MRSWRAGKLIRLNIDLDMIIKGDPRAQKRHRHRRQGNATFTYDPSSSEKKPVVIIMRSMWSKRPLKGAISVAITFYCKRPKSHYRTGKNSHLLKGSVPVVKITKPDIDNHVKFYMDCGKDILWNDDSQVIRLEAWKVYEDEQGPRTEMEVWEV